MSGQTPYNLNENTLSSLASNVGTQLKKAAKFVGKQESAKVKEAAIAQAEQEMAKAAQAAKEEKAAAKEPVKSTRVRKPKTYSPSRTPAAKAASAPDKSKGAKRTSAFPPIKPVVLTRQQHFESAVGNSKDASATRPVSPKKDTVQSSVDPSTAYND